MPDSSASRPQTQVAAPLEVKAVTPSRAQRLEARERAMRFLVGEKVDERRSREGALLGIQATLDAGTLGGMSLASLVDLPASDLPRAWRDLARRIEKKLGAPLEPELFSNMLFVATLGAEPRADLRALCARLRGTFRDRHVGGLHHFFASPAFACDVDCTGVAARARLVSGDLDPTTPRGAAELRAITGAILRSASVTDVASEDNRTHGKDNGPLFAHVFKVYLDDHVAQGRELDRGLKVNPVVVSNALYSVLAELRLGLRDPSERVALREYVEGREAPRTGEATVESIVRANVDYVSRWLTSGAFRSGCRYYPSPDAFLCFYSESVRAFPEAFARHDAEREIQAAVRERRVAAHGERWTDPTSVLNAALRGIAARNVGLDAAPEGAVLLARQDATGAFRSADCLYALGSDPGTPLGFRSDLLTTAFAIRALGDS